MDRLATRAGEHRLRAVALANLAEVARLDGRLDDAERLGRRAVAQLQGVGDPNHRRRVLATIGLALAGAGRAEEAERVLAELRPSAGSGFPADGPAAVVEGAVALLRGERMRAAQSFAGAAQAYEGGHDPRDVVPALIGLVISAPDDRRRDVALARLDRWCASAGITLLPRELALIGR